MPIALDIASHTLHLVNGQVVDTEPLGFAQQSAPRKAARGREKDTLLLCLSLRSRGAPPDERYTELVELATTTFFSNPGTVTAALRQAFLAVNQRLLDLNLREGAPVQGGLVGAVLRNDDKADLKDFYAAHCGAGALLVARGLGLEKFPTEMGRPLGLSHAPDLHYFHTTVGEGEYVCLTNAAPASWNDLALAGLGNLATLSAVTERLTETAEGDVSAWVGRLEAISLPTPSPAHASRGGLASLLRARVESPAIPVPERVTSAPPAAVAQPPEMPFEAASAATPAETDWKDLVQRAERLGQSDPTPHIPILEELPPLTARVEPEAKSRTEWRTQVGQQITHGLRSFGRALSNTLAEANTALRKLVARTLPEGTLQKEGIFHLPDSVQLGIVLVSAVVMSSIGLFVYQQYGRAQTYENLVAQATAVAATSQQESDPAKARGGWLNVVTWLTQAEQIRFDPDVAALKQKAQAQLDLLDSITRLEYRPLVVGGLGRDVRVKRLALIGQDVFALDETTNRVLRLTPSANNTGYRVDRDFACGGGQVGPVAITTLVDLEMIPGPNVMGEEAIVALDTDGNLLYCASGKAPLARSLPIPTNAGWVPIAFEIYTNRLYVLDPLDNQVWQYQEVGGDYLQASGYFPTLVFDLSNVLEFSIAGGDVYLMHRDGGITICSRANASDTPQCQSPAPVTDERRGHTSTTKLDDVTTPVSLVYAPPPEPSLYLLNSDTGGVYQLSLKLAFVKQFRPQSAWPEVGLALEIDPAKRVFVGAGDNVYFASTP
jgi:hypothetical protein